MKLFEFHASKTFGKDIPEACCIPIDEIVCASILNAEPNPDFPDMDLKRLAISFKNGQCVILTDENMHIQFAYGELKEMLK